MVCCALIPTPEYLRFYFRSPQNGPALSVVVTSRGPFIPVSSNSKGSVCLFHTGMMKWKSSGSFFTLGWDPSVVTWDEPFFFKCVLWISHWLNKDNGFSAHNCLGNQSASSLEWSTLFIEWTLIYFSPFDFFISLCRSRVRTGPESLKRSTANKVAHAP